MLLKCPAMLLTLISTPKIRKNRREISLECREAKEEHLSNFWQKTGQLTRLNELWAASPQLLSLFGYYLTINRDCPALVGRDD